MSRLTTVEELEHLPPYTAVRGISSIPIIAHRSPNGIWWSTFENPITVEELIDLCPDGFDILYDKNQMSEESVNSLQAFKALEVLTFFSHLKPVTRQEKLDNQKASEILRTFLSDATMSTPHEGDHP